MAWVSGSVGTTPSEAARRTYWPAMGQDQGYPAPSSGPFMEEVEMDATELGAELSECVQR